MNRFSNFFPFCALAGLALALSGCDANTPNKGADPPVKPSAVESPNQDAHDPSPEDIEKAKAELAKLSPADGASAQKQRVCPVTGEMLGLMGSPKKVDVKDQQVWICCEGCREELLANADKYLARLQKGE